VLVVRASGAQPQVAEESSRRIQLAAHVETALLHLDLHRRFFCLLRTAFFLVVMAGYAVA
jgi:hypothetical protein